MPRAEVASGRRLAGRVAAAVIGGYLFAAAAVVATTAALAPLLGRVDAVWLGTMPGVLLYAASILFAFCTRSTLRAWAWLLGGAAALIAVRLAMG